MILTKEKVFFNEKIMKKIFKNGVSLEVISNSSGLSLNEIKKILKIK